MVKLSEKIFTFLGRLKLAQAILDYRIAITLYGFLTIILMNIVKTIIPKNIDLYSFGYPSFRGWACDLIDVVTVLILIFIILLSSIAKKYLSYRLLVTGFLFYYIDQFLQLFVEQIAFPGNIIGEAIIITMAIYIAITNYEKYEI